MADDKVLQGRFISRILREEAQNIEQAKLKAVVAFNSRRDFAAKYTNNENTLTMTHPMELRFIDMKTRGTKNGKVRKKSFPVHNKILMRHANIIVRRISFEYTSEMIDMMRKAVPKQV